MFSAGDEIECIARAPKGSPVQKGDRFVCRAFAPKGAVVAPDGSKLGDDCVSIGLVNPYLLAEEPDLTIHDLWIAEHFRKIERKRTREELHALIGISDMLGQRAPELV